MFISILYTFRAFKCSSSGDPMVSTQYPEYVTLKTSEWSKITKFFILKCVTLYEDYNKV